MRASPVPSDHQQPPPFPAGSFAFVTALSRTSTACTSNPNAFRCYAYTTPKNTSRADAPAADSTTTASPPPASATFFWTIAPAGASYAVSAAAANPFGPQFADVAARLLDGDRPTERLAFEVPLVAAVVPTVALDRAGNRAVTCYYNHTLLSATLWTRRPAAAPATGNLTSAASAAAAAAAARAFPRWPYAVEVRQVARAGPAVPDCRDVAGRRVGDVSLPADRGGECSCAYANFGL